MNTNTRILRATLIVIGVVQAVLGLLFLLAPAATADLLGLSPAAPAWANWLFAEMAARFLGFAVGMFLAARDPFAHRNWITAMIGIQAIDWVATVTALAQGGVALSQVATAPFLPVPFVLVLWWWHPTLLERRQSRTAARTAALTATAQ